MGYYNVSSGQICNNTYLEKSSMTVSEGGIVNSTAVFQSGTVTVRSGGIANSTTVYSGGAITVLSGGMANSVTVNSRGGMGADGTANVVTVNFAGQVSVNGTVNSATVNGGGMTVLSGGTANSITVNGGRLNIGNDGTATEIVENGGCVDVASNANVTFVPNVFSNCYPQEAGSITLHSGTTAVNLQFYDLTIYDGGVAENASAFNGDMFLSGGTANGAVLSGGRLTILSGGVANDTELNYFRRETTDAQFRNCSMTVSRGGTANRTVVKGFRNDLYNFSGGIMTLSGGIANNTSVFSGGILNISGGGVANDTVVGGFGALCGPDDEIDSGTVNVLAGGTANNVMVNMGGMLCVGGKAVGIVENGGYVDVQSFKTATFASNTFSGLILYSAPVPYSSGGLSATVHSGTTAVDVTLERGGLLEVFSGGKLTGRLVNLGGTVSVDKDAIIDFDLTRTAPGAEALINDFTGISGTPIYTLTVNANQTGGIYKLAAGASEFQETITVVNTDGIVSGTLTVGETSVISGIVYSLALSDDILSLRIGETDTPSQYTSDGVIVSSGAVVAVGQNETYHDTLICSGGALTFDGKGSADGVTVNSGGSLSVSKGGTAVNIVENGGFVEFAENGAELSFAPHAFGNCYLKNATLHSGTTACDVKVAGSLFVYEGGVADGVEAWTPYRDGANSFTVIVSGGTANNVTLTNAKSIMNVSSGGVANNAKLTVAWADDEGGRLNISSGASANGTFVGNNGAMTIETGGTATDTTILGGTVQIMGKGAADRVTVCSGGTLTVANTASAANIIENGGYVKATPGKNVSFASNSFAGLVLLTGANATVHSGTTAFDTTISAGAMHVYDGGITERTYVKPGGRMFVSSGGAAKDAIVSAGGSMILINKGTADGTIVDSGGALRVSVGASANNTVVNAGGRLMVDNGTVNGLVIDGKGSATLNNCKLTGRIWLGNIGATIPVINVNEGTTLDFDLTQTSAGAGALVNALSCFAGVTLYTLTVEEKWETGSYDYYLALGASGFDSTITVVNKKGDELGVLTVGETVGIGGIDYTLKRETNDHETFFLTLTVDVPDSTPKDLVGTAEQVSWEAYGAEQFIVEYSMDDFEHVIQIVTTGNAVDTPDLPAGTYQWRVKAAEGGEWAVGEAIVSEAESDTPKVVEAVWDGNDDLFFASQSGTWSSIFFAQHVGSINDWEGTNETIEVNGKGRIRNLFFGTADPNVLCLTDADNGDGIFVDDVYTDLPEEVEEHMARLYMIQEIRAGAGDDIVDMTSQRFEYIGDGLTIRGGDGNDVIWANKGDNMLFGDAGNDRIVGASGDDVIIGGIGNDSMHGGGGNDVFVFCDNWGIDTVEQLASGKVTLWFASGDESNWNAETLTYTDGTNSVTVSGVSVEQVTLKFGDDGSELFAALSNAGAFDDFTSQRIFEESDSGILASL